MVFSTKAGLLQPTLADVVIADHRITMAMLDLFSEAAKAEDKQMMEKLLDAITLEIRFHSQAEMDVLYPLMAKKVKDGQQLEKHVLEEHGSIEKDMLEALKLRKEGGEKLTEVMEHAKKTFLAHIKEEENQLVPQLLEEITAEEQTELALQLIQSKEKAPFTPQVPPESKGAGASSPKKGAASPTKGAASPKKAGASPAKGGPSPKKA